MRSRTPRTPLTFAGTLTFTLTLHPLPFTATLTLTPHPSPLTPHAGAANLDVIQEVEYVKQEAKVVYLLECLQKTAPPLLPPHLPSSLPFPSPSYLSHPHICLTLLSTSPSYLIPPPIYLVPRLPIYLTLLFSPHPICSVGLVILGWLCWACCFVLGWLCCVRWLG